MHRSLLFVFSVALTSTVLIGCEGGDEVFSSLGKSNAQLDPIMQAMAPVCSGQGVPGTGLYSSGGPHHAVLLSSAGGKHDWSYALPGDWWPVEVSDTELVVCVGDESRTYVGSAYYGAGGAWECKMYKKSVHVDIREAGTARIVAQTDLVSWPPEPPDYDGPAELEASEVEYSALETWLLSIVQ